MLYRPLVFVVLAGCLIGDPHETDDELEAETWGPYDPKPGHPTIAERDAFVAEIGAYAREAEDAYGTPAAALTAMTANESGFGWTRIALDANNLFGWKWYSPEAAGGRTYYVLANQPADDPNDRYVVFASRRESVLFVASKLAHNARYKPHTDRYMSDRAAGIDIVTAANRWIDGIAYAGYNPYAHYPATTIKFMNNYRSPSTTRSPQYDLYRLSTDRSQVWISVDTPAANATVRGNVSIASSAGGGSVTSVRFHTRAKGAGEWYAIGEDTAAPFTRTWATDPWVPDGAYDVKVEAWSGTTLRATGVIAIAVDNTP